MKNVSVRHIVLISLFILFIAHLTLGENGKKIAFSGSVMVSIFAILIYLYIFSREQRNIFVLISILFFCMHFPIFLGGGGGLFNLISALLPIILVLFPPCEKTGTDRFATLVLALLFVSNLAGYFSSELGVGFIVNGFVAFVGMLTAFALARRLVLFDKKIRILICISSILSILNLFIVFNTLFQIIPLRSPLLFSIYERAEYQEIANTGTLATTELFGEWSMLNSFLLLPFIFFKGSSYLLKRNERLLINVGYLASLISGFISFSRSIIFLLIAGTLLMFLTMICIERNGSFKLFPKILLLIILVISLAFLFSANVISNFLAERIDEVPAIIKDILRNPFTGIGTSREKVYALGWERLSQKKWLFGNGWSTPSGNYYSWFESYELMDYADFHNLYLCLIPILGLSGLTLVLMLFLRAIFKLVGNIWRCRRQSILMLPFMIGILFVLVFFLIDEYKINATRNSYFTIVLIWLGFAFSTDSTIKQSIDAP